MRLTCYVGGQIDSVTESSAVLQDTNLQFNEHDKLSVIGAVQKNNMHAQHIQAEPNSNGFFFVTVFVSFFSFLSTGTVFLFFQELSV